jgi:hypothetical protein
MAKHDSASQRLKQSIAKRRDARKQDPLNAPVGLLGQNDWNDPLIWATGARRALTLHPFDDALKKAFEVFNCNPQNPFHWRAVITCLAQAHFDSKPRGAPVKWTSRRLYALLVDFDRIHKSFIRPPLLNRPADCCGQISH